MTQFYNVAGHIFSLSMAEECAIWPQLTNYAPFRVEEASELLFALEVRNEGTPFYSPERAKHLLTDSSDEDMPRIELYEQDDKMLFRISMYRNAPVCFEMRCSNDYSQAEIVIFSTPTPVGERGSSRFPVDNALMLLFAFRSAVLGTLEMHASVIKLDDKAYLFLGKSGTGKSTHSRQWLAAFPNAQLLNDDNPIVKIFPRPKQMENHPVNGSKRNQEGLEVRVFGSPWSGKTPCYKNDSAPVAGIVLLRQAPENKMQRLSLPEAYAAVYSSSSGLRCNPAMADGLHETVVNVVTTVPVYLLDCLPNEDAARLCRDTINQQA